MAFRKLPKPAPASNEAFLARVYEELLDRPVDPTGRKEYMRQLLLGRERSDIALEIAASEEHRQVVLSRKSPRHRRPDAYRMAVDTAGTNACWAFDVASDADFDWMESAILDDGYYEAPNAWGFEIDDDKRVMADLVAQFAPKRALEIGCSSGAVLRALLDHDIAAEGIEISQLALDRAHPEVRDRIHLGDLLDLDLGRDYDFVYGLDIFEHLNPNRLSRYLEATRALLVDGGSLFTVVPAFGKDAVFGEVFPLYLAEWDADVAANRPFRTLHTDDAGYPMHGHLIWAHTDWWVAQFEAAGFVRQPEVEAGLQERYRAHFEAEPARRSSYVFTTA
jgi:SAM-dependent methyltransferase